MSPDNQNQQIPTGPAPAPPQQSAWNGVPNPPAAPVQQPQYNPYAQYQQPAPVPPPMPNLPPRPLGSPSLNAPKKPGGPFALLFNDWMKEHWRRVLLIAVGVVLLGMMIFQIVYPSGRLLPGTVVDGVKVGGLRKDEAAKKLDDIYSEVALNIYFGKNDAAFQTPQLKDVGVSVVNENRIEAIDYPWLLRFIPGSFMFVNSFAKAGDLEYAYDKTKIQDYTQGKVGDTCTIPAKDATLKQIDSQLQVVASVPGGECDINQFQQALAEVRPTGDEDSDANKVRIDSTETPAKVDDDKARELADKLNTRLKDPMPMSLGSDSQSIAGRVVMGWLDFKSDIPADSIDKSANQSAKLVYSINKDRMETYLNGSIAAKVVKKPGVSKVTTLDFTETARVNGAGGRVLDVDKIVTSVTDYINSKTEQSVAVTHDVGPTVVYTRNYSPTSVGFSALLTQFAQDNPGTYGLAFNEITNVKFPRSASYNADARFPSEGIDSLYIGYAVLLSKKSGELRPAEKIAGDKIVDTCYKDMFIKSDEACRMGFYNRFGYNAMVERGKELGLKNTVFAEKSGVTSANDLQNVLIGLYKNQIARDSGGQALISNVRAIRANDGIPSGVPGVSVAHFVGENKTIYNDAAVVYSPKGIYALTILSKDSSWEKVAALTKKIEALKQVKIPVNAR